MPTYYLQANRQSVLGETRGNGGRGLSRHVELIGEGDPLEWVGLLAFNRLRALDALLEGCARNRGR
jgi:hypothetical protein